jgi:hypothetical protein
VQLVAVVIFFKLYLHFSKLIEKFLKQPRHRQSFIPLISIGAEARSGVRNGCEAITRSYVQLAHDGFEFVSDRAVDTWATMSVGDRSAVRKEDVRTGVPGH